MRKPLASLLILSASAAAVALMTAAALPEEPVQARIVTVARADVRKVAALSGRLGYKDEAYLFAQGGGSVSRVCVEVGDRVAAGEAVVRLNVQSGEELLEAFIAHSSALEEWIPDYDQVYEAASELAVVRAQHDCTVRQLLVDDQAVVAAGTPVARVTSVHQQIVCSAAPADAQKLTPGMWAWLKSDGEELGFGVVTSVGEETADPLTGLRLQSVAIRPEQHIELPEGAAVEVEVFIAGSDDVCALPIEAITSRDTVWWVTDGGICTEIPAQIVLCDEMHAWVNLPEGISVAVGEFREGQWVREAEP